MIKTVFSVDGMACSMCEAHVNDAIRKAAGKVKKVTSSHSKGISEVISEEPLDEPYLPEPMEGSFGPYVVPEGAYFMMGDNRNYSLDARYWQNHYISRDKMVAKVFFEYFPTPKVIH